MQAVLKSLRSKKYNCIACAVHLLFSFLYSHYFFTQVKPGAGSENVSYKFLITGDTLRNDLISRALCWGYAHVLAIFFIFLFWDWIFFVIRAYRQKIVERTYWYLYVALIVAGLVTIFAIYPSVLTVPADTNYNYIYAKEWLPMYWHGFLTNVVQCACMFTFLHPISLSVIQFLFGINIVLYFTYVTLIKCDLKNKIVKAFIWGLILLLMPETIRILMYFGRNYSYAILSTGFLGILLMDYIIRDSNPKTKSQILSDSLGKLTKKKFVILTFLAVCLATWRSEGIIYLIFYPFLLYFTYAYKQCDRSSWIKKLPKALLFVVCAYIVLSLPDKYGSEKYQGYDYFIINTPGPLSAVMANPNANLSYRGAEKDLHNIEAVLPQEYIYKFGQYAMAYYNCDQIRFPRQCAAGDGGKTYLFSSYNVFIHNLPIYVKYQTNLFFESIGASLSFNIATIEPQGWAAKSDEAREWFLWWSEYYSMGDREFSEHYKITIINPAVHAFLNEGISKIINALYECGWFLSGYVKIVVTILVCAVTIIKSVKREWLFVVIGLLNVALLAVVILAAPTSRENYYYSVYFNQYWFLFFACMRFRIAKRNGCYD